MVTKKQLDQINETGIDSIVAEYVENEELNSHTDNYILLAKYFGSETELRKCENILAERDRVGELNAVDDNWLYENINPYYYLMMVLQKKAANE